MKGFPSALGIVQKYFPGVNRVDDATKPVVVEVTQIDNELAVPLSHRKCALAVACKRQEKADGVMIGMSSAYIIHGKRALRYIVLESAIREVVSFDRNAGFDLGTYKLRPPSKAARLGERKRRGEKRNRGSGQKRGPLRHITGKVRTPF